EPDVNDLDSEHVAGRLQYRSDLGHQGGALVGQDVAHLDRTDLVAQRLVQCDHQPALRRLLIAGGAIELACIHDPVAHIGRDHQELLVAGQQLERRRVDIDDAAIDISDMIHERHAPVETWIALHDVDQLAEADHDGILRLLDKERRGVAQNQEQNNDDDGYGEAAVHQLVLPEVVVPVAVPELADGTGGAAGGGEGA